MNIEIISGEEIKLVDTKGNVMFIKDLGNQTSIKFKEYTGVRLIRENNVCKEFYYDTILLRNPNTQPES